MMRISAWVQNLFRSDARAVHGGDVSLSPAQPIVAIGDIHGCFAQLKQLLVELEVLRGDHTFVFVGDMIDRGPHSNEVLQNLYSLASSDPDRVIVLRGNHEVMLTEFIDDPAGRGARWLVNGGLETLQSFGIVGLQPRPDAEDAMEAADRLSAALGPDMINWIRHLPLHWASGNVHCVHASMNPLKAPDQQSKRSLLWGHQDFFKTPREDGIVVVHGHTIVPRPGFAEGRISIDTGAFRSGRLTAAVIRDGSCDFRST